MRSFFARPPVSIRRAGRPFVAGETKAEVDALVCGGLNLRENVFAIERNHRFAGTRFHINTE
jgi:hypothetical protein